MRNRRIDMHRIHIRIAKQLIKTGISLGHPKLIAHALQALRIPLADRIHLRIRMRLKNLDEFRPNPSPTIATRTLPMAAPFI